ncbi:putative transposase [Saccharopolyspora erythraea NRRL 2338]|uniref:IS200-like transposase n=1 Tax=Saccharopolyspora erythraea (strain ATCC 11635 / DSM 40517 / JCM 4748 / NBRC 13426 / NCIMB 8594 / NRRL 2338) TaxID=405948 RepID=A4FHK6_SACEN|nr:RNA-guided endonuclease TnpB family protein [Saccharopolyspora erythraea]PFG97223.1 putative transposase [Saccharopolyspora erythraea NRRL 2338]QRK93702.1 transposase [Saccharopolyspora erythraea]CAM03531.1 putative IS200-like transposase [Saccharopolyspora erythraea NRRL 2338]
MLRTFGCVRKLYNLALDARTRAWFTEQRRVNYTETSAMLTAWKKTDEWSRPLPEGAEPSTVTVSRDAADRWFVSLLVETSVEQHDLSDTAVGVDAGISSLATLSTGGKITNPKHENRDRTRLAKARRELARKQKGSNNRDKARRKVARGHARITDRRRDHLHKVTTRLVRENQTVVIEDLQVRNMLRNGTLNVRTWTCSGCNTAHDRDVNAAKNIPAAGLAVSACGAGVRPQRETSRTGSRLRSRNIPARAGREFPPFTAGSSQDPSFPGLRMRAGSNALLIRRSSATCSGPMRSAR